MVIHASMLKKMEFQTLYIQWIFIHGETMQNVHMYTCFCSHWREGRAALKNICLGMETLLTKNTKLLSTANQLVDILEVLTVVLYILKDAEIILLSTYPSEFLAPNQYLSYQRRSEREDIYLSSSDSLINHAGHLPTDINVISCTRFAFRISQNM